MPQVQTLKSGLTLITVDLPHLESVTSMIAVGAGSRYESREVGGISHFLEHMFFKGSKKYPTAEMIATMVDSIGAVNNAATSKEFTFYWIKSASKHLELAADILSSMYKESLLAEEEISREKGVIVEEIRMIRDNPARYIWDLYESLQFGDQPLGWDIIGTEKNILSFKRDNFVDYINRLYSPENTALVFVGKIPKNIEELAEKYFSDLPRRGKAAFNPYKQEKLTKPRINIYHKPTDQANLILGVEGYDRHHPKRYTVDVLGVILGEGMSSRLFIQVRERRGLAYHVMAGHDSYIDTGSFVSYAGLKLDKATEGLKVIRGELERTISEKVTEEELKKAKELLRGRLAIKGESTNFLAEYFGTHFVIDRHIETFDEYLGKVDEVTREDIQEVAKELFQKDRYNLQVIGPFKDAADFEKALS